MTPILADISNGWILGCTIASTFAAIAAVVVATVALNKKTDTNITNQPLDIQLVEQFVTKREFNEHVKGTNRELHQLREIFRLEIPEMERRITSAGETRVTKLHDRINDVLKEVSTLEGKVDQALLEK